MASRSGMIRLLVVSLGWAVARAETCTALRGGPFTYEQESAPRDISAALRLVTGLINKELTAVVNVELPYVGELALEPLDAMRRVGVRV